MPTKGSLVCVGLGMTLGAHISPRSRSHIRGADVVFAVVSDPLVELWLKQMHRDVRSLQGFYEEGKSRTITYEQMVDALLVEVRSGKRVCGAFYGHPGVFAWAPHKAIEMARAEGYPAQMEPGISAEDCLYADLGIDPGRHGCQHYEASQMMVYQRRIDPSAYLVLWQVGVAGDQSHRRFATSAPYRQVLVDVLLLDYPAGHVVTLYEAATVAIDQPRIEYIALTDLVHARVEMQTTLVIPPCRPMQKNLSVIKRLDRLDAEAPSA